jgi:hypothetical protein
VATKQEFKNSLKRKALNNKDLVPGNLSEGHADYIIEKTGNKTRIGIKETSGEASQLTDFVLVVKGGEKNIGESLDVNQTRKLGQGFMAIGGHVFDSAESEPNNFVEVKNLEGFAFLVKTESCLGGWKFPEILNDPIVFEGNPDREGDTDLTVSGDTVGRDKQQITFDAGAGCVQVKVEIFKDFEKEQGKQKDSDGKQKDQNQEKQKKDNKEVSGIDRFISIFKTREGKIIIAGLLLVLLWQQSQ